MLRENLDLVSDVVKIWRLVRLSVYVVVVQHTLQAASLIETLSRLTGRVVPIDSIVEQLPLGDDLLLRGRGGALGAAVLAAPCLARALRLLVVHYYVRVYVRPTDDVGGNVLHRHVLVRLVEHVMLVLATCSC